MTTEYETRYAIGQREAKQYDTQELRDAFLADKLMQPGKVYWIYSHYERFMVGGAV
ncbi:MAG: 5-dehydro-4-deoxy-D-glucuronate isomerase, partial [Aestuariibacter sp.]|nr:5-dehydro-4-deoxy-D-glucuronate isomerase [Aestuariibacter sp.]MCP5013560.1 5-dehydro-4-deoxy-D-glucuronate isomerase [Aestuariibacter sp.]